MKYILVCVSFIASSHAFSAPQVKTYKYGELQTYLAADFLYATQTFDDSGSSQSLTKSGDYYYVAEMPIGARYSLTDSWAVNLELQVGASESKTSDTIYKATRSNSVINEIHLGTDFLMMEAPIELIPELDLIFPLEKYDTSTDVAMTSEGVMQATLALRGQQKFGSWVTFGRLGYTYRASGRSSLVPYSIACAYDSGKTLYGLEIGGSQSVSNDQDKANPLARTTAITRDEAGVRRFFSINPSYTDLTLFINMDLSARWKWDLNAGYIVAGSNYAQGPHIGTVLTMNWDLFQKTNNRHNPISAPLNPESQLSTDKDIQLFKEEVHDGVDQKIFQARPTPAQKQTQKKKVGPSKKRVLPSTSDLPPTDEQLQKQLDNTEMQIQLKKNRN